MAGNVTPSVVLCIGGVRTFEERVVERWRDHSLQATLQLPLLPAELNALAVSADIGAAAVGFAAGIEGGGPLGGSYDPEEPSLIARCPARHASTERHMPGPHSAVRLLFALGRAGFGGLVVRALRVLGDLGGGPG